MLKIFLSYARRDSSVAAARLRSELERANFTVWQDIENMRGGIEWKEQLRDALHEVDVVLVLLTPAAINSPNVTWEWESAQTLRKRIIPLLISACTIPADLNRLHFHNLNSPDEYALGLMALIRDLNSITNNPAPRENLKGLQDRDTINIQGGFYQPGWTIQGDNLQAQRDIVISARDVNQGSEVLTGIFTELMQHVQLLAPGDQMVVKPVIEQAQSEATRIEQGDKNPDTEKALKKWLKTLHTIAPDIGEIAINTLSSPLTGVAITIRKIAEKLYDEVKIG